MSLLVFIIACFNFTNPAYSANSTDSLTQARVLMQKEKWSEVEDLIKKTLEAEPAKNRELLFFQLGQVQYKQKKFAEALDSYKSAIEFAENLKDYSYFFRAQTAEQLNDTQLAESLYKEVDHLGPNFKLKIESQKNLALILLEKKKFREAAQILAPLEKRSRGTETYPEVIYHIARAQSGLKNKSMTCKYLKKLYVKFPTFERVKNWSQDLEKNEFQGAPTDCSSQLSDFKERIKSLMWMGADQKALTEIQIIRELNQKQSPETTDIILAQFYLQEGEVQKALDLLKSHFSDMKNNFDYLLMYASYVDSLCFKSNLLKLIID